MAVGPPFKLTEKVIERYVHGLNAGVPLATAARYAGVAPGTMRKYLASARAIAAEGRKPKNKRERMLMKLLETHEETESEVEIRLAANIQIAADAGDWRAAAWILPRRFEHWAENYNVKLTGADGGPVQIEGTNVLDSLAAFAVDAEDDTDDEAA